jgi:hypothetical protein
MLLGISGFACGLIWAEGLSKDTEVLLYFEVALDAASKITPATFDG